MAALTNDRNTPERAGSTTLVRPLAASTTIYQGAMVAQDANGKAVPAGATATLTVLGRAAHRASTASGTSLPGEVRIERGCYRFNNSASTDAITIADYGKQVYAVDDQTVAKTSATSTRPVAGVVRDVDAQGVWVEF